MIVSFRMHSAGDTGWETVYGRVLHRLFTCREHEKTCFGILRTSADESGGGERVRMDGVVHRFAIGKYLYLIMDLDDAEGIELPFLRAQHPIIEDVCFCEWMDGPVSDDAEQAADEIRLLFGDGLRNSFGCPEVNCEWFGSMGSMIIHLNDDHRFSRGRVADWVEQTAEENGIDLSFPIPGGLP